MKVIHFFLALSMFLSIGNFLTAQNLELLLGGKKNTEKDLWKKDRLKYYLNSGHENETQPESYFYRGQEKLQRGLFKEAIADYKKAITHDNFPAPVVSNAENGASNRAAYLSISFCFQQLSLNDSALFYCEKSITEDKYYLDAYIQKVAILADMDNFKSASDFLDKAEKIFPSSKKIYFAKAQIYRRQNKISKTEKYLKKAIEIDPDFNEANILLASIYFSEHDLNAAMKMLTHSVNSAEKPVISLYYRAMIYLSKNEMEKAYHDIYRAYHLDTVDSPMATMMVFMDYYFEEYAQANKLALEIWTKNMTRNNIIDNQVDYQQYEVGYFLRFINDKSAKQQEINTLNECFHNLAQTKYGLAESLTEEFADQYPASLFAKRLSLYASIRYNKYDGKYQINFYFGDNLGDERIVKPHTLSYFPQKINAIDEIIAMDSSIVSMYWIKGMLEFLQGNYAMAIHTVNEGIEIDSTFLNPYKIRVLCNLLVKNYSLAIPDLEKILQSEDNFSGFGFPLAYAYFHTGQYEKALKINTKIINTQYSTERVFYNLGLCYEKLNKPDSALVYFIHASRLFPLHREYTLSVARVYKNMGDDDKAMEVLKDAQKQEFSDFMLIVDIADLYVEMGDDENAIIYYKKAYHRKNSFVYAYLGAANCYKRMKKYKTALSLYDQAIGANPKYAYSYYAKGLCLAGIHKYEKSNESAYKAIQLNDRFSAAYFLMAENYFNLGRYLVSVSMGLNALKYDPGNKEVMYQLAVSSLARGNTDAAIKFYKKIIDMEQQNKSVAYAHAIDMLKLMMREGIQAQEAKKVLETVFHEGD